MLCECFAKTEREIRGRIARSVQQRNGAKLGRSHLENQLDLLAVSTSRRSQAAHAVDQSECQTATGLLHSACMSAKRMKTYSTTWSLSLLVDCQMGSHANGFLDRLAGFDSFNSSMSRRPFRSR